MSLAAEQDCAQWRSIFAFKSGAEGCLGAEQWRSSGGAKTEQERSRIVFDVGAKMRLGAEHKCAQKRSGAGAGAEQNCAYGRSGSGAKVCLGAEGERSKSVLRSGVGAEQGCA